MTVYTTVTGNNAQLIAEVARLYLKPDDKVADVTYGKGVFWRNTPVPVANFFPSDLVTCEPPHDFRTLPYPDEKFDVVVFDPPYMHTVGRPIADDNYRNRETTKSMYHADIMQLYRDGMTEATRVLGLGGFLWVKCQDEIESGYQRWSHIDIYNIATDLKLYGKDLFVMIRTGNPPVQYTQKHARKKHSYLWVFQKIDHSKFDRLAQKGIVNTATVNQEAT